MARCASCKGEFEASRQAACPLCGAARPRPLIKVVESPRLTVEEALAAMGARETRPRRRRRRRPAARDLAVTQPPRTGVGAPRTVPAPIPVPRRDAPAVTQPIPLPVPMPRRTPEPTSASARGPQPLPPPAAVVPAGPAPRDTPPASADPPPQDVEYVFGVESGAVLNVVTTIEVLDPKPGPWRPPPKPEAEPEIKVRLTDALSRVRRAAGI